MIAGLLDVLLVDRGHVEATVWGASLPLIWALLGLVGVAATAGLAWAAARVGLLREHDPYDEGGRRGWITFLPFSSCSRGRPVVPLFPGAIRAWAFLVAPAVVFVQLLFWLDVHSGAAIELAGLTLTLLEVNELNEVWGTIFALVALGGGAFALHLRDRGQQSAALAYGGSAFGVLFAGDLLTLVIFWELMAVASFYLVMSGGRAGSKAAAQRYLFVHLVGGSALLGGILWHAGTGAGLEIATFESGPGGWLMLFGVLVNAAMFPLHAWLPDAYPESSPTGMVFLGAFTTKTTVYVLVRLFPGWDVLVLVGGVHRDLRGRSMR